MSEDRQRFEKYVTNINKLLQSEEFYLSFQKKLRGSKPSYKLVEKHRNKVFDLEWVDIIESTLPNLDNIVRNPRKFIVLEEDIVDISLARAISTESVKHLAQHTNMIASVDKEGNVTPNKILNITKEESYEIYENRFIFTLLKNVNQFLTRRLDAIKSAYVNDHVLELDVDTSVFTGKTRVFYKLELIASLPFDEVKELDNNDLTVVERIAKMQRIINEFMGSPFAKQMANSAPVRPPITRTNVILKNPDFKKALVLWQFVESYQKMGFSVENQVKNMAIDNVVQTNIQDMVCLSSMLMEGLIQGNVADDSFFKESLMDEKDLKETKDQGQMEVEKETDQKEVEEAFDQQNTPEEQEDTPQQENEQEQKTETTDNQEENASQPENEGQDNDQDEDELLDSMSIPNSRNMFQRTSDEANLTKAEITRINKAIDRIIIREKTLNAESNIQETLNKSSSENLPPEVITARLEREKENIRRALERKAKLAEKERLANEKMLKEQEERLKELEEEINSKQQDLAQQNNSSEPTDTQNIVTSDNATPSANDISSDNDISNNNNNNQNDENALTEQNDISLTSEKESDTSNDTKIIQLEEENTQNEQPSPQDITTTIDNSTTIDQLDDKENALADKNDISLTSEKENDATNGNENVQLNSENSQQNISDTPQTKDSKSEEN